VNAERIPTLDDLEETDLSVLAAIMTGQLDPRNVDGYPWCNTDAASVVTAILCLRDRWNDAYSVRQVIRIDGEPIALEDVATHPGRERVTVGLEVPRLDSALDATECPDPERVATWATHILHEYRAAVAPDISQARQRHAERDALIAAIDLAEAYRSTNAAGVRDALLRIRQAVA